MTLKPLVVDLDGTLIRSDLLVETALIELARRPLSIFALIRSLMAGKAALKHRLSVNEIDPALLPYDERVLDTIKAASDQGRPVYLASASSEKLVASVADHLGVFAGYFGSDFSTNLSGEAKAARLVSRFGRGGFDYVGNGRADLPVWEAADHAIAVRLPTSVAKALATRETGAEFLTSESAGWRVWARQLRVYQYVKNALLFVPILTAQAFHVDAVGWALLGFAAFCLCASSVYILNDLLDLTPDRAHPTKRNRPLAAGRIPLTTALVVQPLLLLTGLGLAALVSPGFLAVTLGYVALTTAYSFYLKRKFLLDAIVLSLLYTLRVFAGAVAIHVVVSQWLLGFSMFIFTALALIKRYTELTIRMDQKLDDSSTRNYRATDIDVVLAMAAAAGMNAVTVMALYVASEDVHRLYRTPQALWLICPVLLYWIGRALMMARRRYMDDDPIVFAIKDRVSWICGVTMVAILAFAK